jgi:hypothetical protein
MFILKQYDVPLFITIEFTQNIILIECSFVSLWWDLYFGVCSLLSECGLPL